MRSMRLRCLYRIASYTAGDFRLAGPGMQGLIAVVDQVFAQPIAVVALVCNRSFSRVWQQRDGLSCPLVIAELAA